MLQHTTSLYVTPGTPPRRRQSASAAILIVLLPLALLFLCAGSAMVYELVTAMQRLLTR